MNRQELRKQIKKLLQSQQLAVLSTSEHGRPYANLVAFHFSQDLHFLYFATARETRKYAILMAEPHVAMLIDSRSNREQDFSRAAAVTVLGRAEEIAGEEKPAAAKAYVVRHPSLRQFVNSPTTALFAVKVQNCIYVSGFREVSEYPIIDNASE